MALVGFWARWEICGESVLESQVVTAIWKWEFRGGFPGRKAGFSASLGSPKHGRRSFQIRRSPRLSAEWTDGESIPIFPCVREAPDGFHIGAEPTWRDKHKHISFSGKRQIESQALWCWNRAISDLWIFECIIKSQWWNSQEREAVMRYSPRLYFGMQRLWNTYTFWQLVALVISYLISFMLSSEESPVTVRHSRITYYAAVRTDIAKKRKKKKKLSRVSHTCYYNSH